jgi:hypothetical protein
MDSNYRHRTRNKFKGDLLGHLHWNEGPPFVIHEERLRFTSRNRSPRPT